MTVRERLNTVPAEREFVAKVIDWAKQLPANHAARTEMRDIERDLNARDADRLHPRGKPSPRCVHDARLCFARRWVVNWAEDTAEQHDDYPAGVRDHALRDANGLPVTQRSLF